YLGFEAYDLVIFPITFGRNLGEGETIAIHRISPDDATARSEEAPRGPKLKGELAGNFGAFLDREWRRHDILWGRLDGAERLIAILLPGTDSPARALRAQLIDEAHREIVCEFFRVDPKNWKERLATYLAKEVPREPDRELVARSAARSTTV